MKHTPGPWQVVSHPRDRTLEVRDANDGPVCQLWKVGNKERHSTDAKLIAAAPDLLDALKAIVKSLAEQDDEGLIEHAQQMIDARAAIAKATGD